PADPAPPAAEPTHPVTRPPASSTSGRGACQPFGGPLAPGSCSGVVLSRVGSAFLDLGTPNDDELSDPPPVDPEPEADTRGKGKANVTAGKGAKGGKAGEGSSAASKATGKGANNGTKKTANQTSTGNPAPAATTRTTRRCGNN
ncbi:hypothetical protein FRC06_007355, partial [Ceratobasidium sp. 370]